MADTYLTAADIITLLHWQADATGQTHLAITRSAIKKWRQRGHITYDTTRRAYPLADVLNYLAKRRLDADQLQVSP